MVARLLRILGQASRLHSRTENNKATSHKVAGLVDNWCLESTLKQSLVDVASFPVLSTSSF